MNLFEINPHCEYANWNENSSWKAFYHEEAYPSGSGPSKTSQKLALWYPGNETDWPYIALVGITQDQIQLHYDCSCAEAVLAMSYIFEFILDVEARFA